MFTSIYNCRYGHIYNNIWMYLCTCIYICLQMRAAEWGWIVVLHSLLHDGKVNVNDDDVFGETVHMFLTHTCLFWRIYVSFEQSQVIVLECVSIQCRADFFWWRCLWRDGEYVHIRIFIHICIYMCMWLYEKKKWWRCLWRDGEYVHIRIFIYMYIYGYVVVCIYTHKYTYTYIYAYMHEYIYTDISMYMYIYTYIYTYTHMCIYIYVDVYKYIYEYINMCMYIYVLIRIYVCMYKYLYVLNVFICTNTE